MTDTLTPPARPQPPRKDSLPKGVSLHRYWKETPDGPAVRHDHERPVSDDTELPVGVWWMCPADPGCPRGEWVFPRADATLARPKMRGCPEHVVELLPGRALPSDDDPKQAARGRLQQALAEKRAAMAKAATDAANARLAALKTASAQEASQLRDSLRGHAPSAAVSLAALVTDWALLDRLGGLETYALGTCLMVGGAVLAYWAVYLGELVWARRMGYTLRELPRSLRTRAMSHARWIAAGVLASGLWLVIAETLGARLDNWQGVVVNMMAAVMIGLVNYHPWAALVERRKAAARAAREAAEAAARAEQERLAAIAAEQQNRRRQAEEAKQAAEQAAQATARKVVLPDDDRITAGRKFADRWQRIADQARERRDLTGAGFELWRTEVVVDETRKLTTQLDGEDFVIGHEFLIRAEPGVLAPRGTAVSPFVAMKPWLTSMLELDTGMIDLAYQPQRLTGDGSDPKPMVNHGLVTLYDQHPLAENVRHPGPSGVYVDGKGVRWGFAGRDMRGQPVYRRHWQPGQAGGGVRIGVTGMGKSVISQVTAYNDLLLGILPVIHDAGKSLMDFIDFMGVFPMGHTNEHRDVIRESMWAEMKRRQAWINTRTATGINGIEVPADPQWDTAGGPPIRVTWEEFHMHARDQKFITYLSSQVRLQRATAIFAEGATQGGGLSDWADQNLKEQMAEILMQLMRVSDHTARTSGYTGGLMPSTLPALPGMLVMQDMKGEPVAYRSAFIPRKPEDPDALYYRMFDPYSSPVPGVQYLHAPELPAETVEVFRRHGLMDLWELGKTKSGREELINAADPEPGPTVVPADAVAPVVKPKLPATDVVLAMLMHRVEEGQPSMVQADMVRSSWWKQVDGPWSKNDGVPAESTVMRACNSLLENDPALVARDDSEKQARWSILPAGFDRAQAALTVMRGAHRRPAAPGQAAVGGVDVVAMEREAMLAAETRAWIEEQQRQVREALNPRR
ncbi:hypothetical protein [Pseudosporangium ferrugineum]|uniref:Uncharacterized protein n=1 Tax=Pseudosporangium ferrugineum TaxID=439699 RepID=A0A2T0RS53_9ACTN|nr:hypothetical protein [Pseudosporangium ferrugineum]PRY24026.1 hypothetical protein CLV70_114159 [Pseudosporangium ferrugineum]